MARIYNEEPNTLVTGTKSADFIFSLDGTNVTINARGGNDTIVNLEDHNSINAGDGNDSIASYGSEVTITGGAGNDLISLSSEYTFASHGNTVKGGKGNDLLWGGGDAETFIYAKGDGKDVIFGFDDSDTLTLDNLKITSATYSKKNQAVTLKFDSKNSITLKDFTATTFHINNDTYKISGSKFNKQ